LGGNQKISSTAINIGSTKGIGSTTRMFNYCKQTSPNPELCINNFITHTQLYTYFIYSLDFTGKMQPIITLSNLPIINDNNSFTNIAYTTTVSNNIMTIFVSFNYIDNNSDDGLSFVNTYTFYNNYLNLTILNFGNIILSRNSNGLGQFCGMSRNKGLNNIIFNTMTKPIIVNGTSLNYCFSNTLFNSNINEWDVSNVNSMTGIFYKCSMFNQPLNNWDVSNVTDIKYGFDMCVLFNQNINNWNISNLTSLNSLFSGNLNFNQPLNNWDVSNVTDFSYTFYNCRKFNQPLNNWNISNALITRYMFGYCYVFNQYLSNWNTINVIDMTYMFFYALLFNNGYTVGDNTHPMNWNVINVTDNNSWGINSLLTFYPTPGTSNNNMFSW
jgi:surface protein